jgi:SAM-dependent methyltransferase
VEGATHSFSPERLERIARMEEWHFWFRGRRAYIESWLTHIALSHSERALDIGCGTGWMVRWLASKGVRSIGLDSLAPALARIRAHGSSLFFLFYLGGSTGLDPSQARTFRPTIRPPQTHNLGFGADSEPDSKSGRAPFRSTVQAASLHGNRHSGPREASSRSPSGPAALPTHPPLLPALARPRPLAPTT